MVSAPNLGFYYIEMASQKGIVAEMLYHFEKSLRKETPLSQCANHSGFQRDDLLPSLESDTVMSR
ncbi:hypothetical protein O9929_03110 [Vibrio lentus]|nr:hypothetical protein [Vibrio lentus]